MNHITYDWKYVVIHLQSCLISRREAPVEVIDGVTVSRNQFVVRSNFDLGMLSHVPGFDEGRNPFVVRSNFDG